MCPSRKKTAIAGWEMGLEIEEQMTNLCFFLVFFFVCVVLGILLSRTHWHVRKALQRWATSPAPREIHLYIILYCREFRIPWWLRARQGLSGQWWASLGFAHKAPLPILFTLLWFRVLLMETLGCKLWLLCPLGLFFLYIRFLFKV